MATAPPPVTPEKAPLTPARAAWMALAIVDTIILAYVAASVPWGIETPSGSSPLGDVIKVVAVVINLAAKAFAAGLMFAVGYAIVQDLRGPWKPSRGAAALLFLPFLAAATFLFYLAGIELNEAFNEKVMRFGDRLVVFDRLSVAHAPGQSIGAYIAVLGLAVYLVEKYTLRWFNVRHVVCILALVFLGWPVREAWERERDQREWLARQEWKAISEEMTFVDALGACKALGPGWRLPLRLEAAIYFASQPETIRAWKGVAWTAMQAEMGRTGVVVELAPRRTGMWRSNYVPWRDRSLCEKDAYSSARTPPNDWFTALLPQTARACMHRRCSSSPSSATRLSAESNPNSS